MTYIIHPSKQKSIIVLLAALVSFFGFEAASESIASYQIPSFLAIAFYVYLFLVFLQTFVFDLKLKKIRSLGDFGQTFITGLKLRFAYLTEGRHWLHFQNYLILPGIIYWATIILLYLSPFDQWRKQTWVILSSLALAVAIWYLKTVFYAHHDATPRTRQMIFLAKVYGSYVAFGAVFGIARYFGYGAGWLWLTVFLLTFLLMYQALFQHHYVGFVMLKFLLFSGVSLGALAYLLYYLWNVNFYSGAFVLAAIYNTIWGIVHHKYIDRNLTREIVYEYLAVLFVVLVILIGTTNFAERI